jgi:hypothetical protein
MRERVKEAVAPGLSSLVFIFLALSILIATGSLNWIGWASLAFGALGLFASVALVMGWQIGPQPRHRPGRTLTRPKPVHHKGPLPALSPARQGQVRRAVQVMADAGVFAPTAPDPAILYPGVAEQDETVKPDTILLALVEANYYHPDFDPASCMANLAQHDMQVEAFADYYEMVIADLVRLSRGALTVTDLAVTQTGSPQGDRMVRTTVTMTVNGEPLTLEADHHIKYFDPFIHEALAARMPADLRLGWLWVDQGAFVTALVPGAVEAMNTAFKLTDKSRCQWEWIARMPA